MNKVITISREFGSGGRELGFRLAEELKIAYYDKEIVTSIVKDTDFAEEFVREMTNGKNRMMYQISIGQSLNVNVDYQIQQMQRLIKAQTEVIREMARKSDCVIVGRCSDYILQELAEEKEIKLYRIFVYADMDFRLKRCMARSTEEENYTEKEMLRQIKRVDRERAAYYEDYTFQRWGERHNYDYMINSSNMDMAETAPKLAKIF